MTTISPHTTRAPGTILTATIYNFDHGNHIANAQALNAGKIEGAGPVVDSTVALFDGTSGSALKASGVSFPLATAQLADDSVTYAKLQNASATARILGRKTSGAGDYEECTLSEVLDFIGSAAQGDILYRGASTWARLGAAGTSGQFLLSTGGGNPEWRGGVPRLISTGTLSNVATLDFTIPSNCETFEFELLNWRPATDAAVLMARFSQSGSYLSGASDYAWAIYSMGSAAGGSDDAADTKMEIGGTYDNASASLGSSVFRVFRPSASSFQKSILGMSKSVNSAGAERMSVGGGRLIANLNAIDGIRFLFSTGNIAEGYYTARAYGG